MSAVVSTRFIKHIPSSMGWERVPSTPTGGEPAASLHCCQEQEGPCAAPSALGPAGVGLGLVQFGVAEQGASPTRDVRGILSTTVPRNRCCGSCRDVWGHQRGVLASTRAREAAGGAGCVLFTRAGAGGKESFGEGAQGTRRLSHTAPHPSKPPLPPGSCFQAAKILNFPVFRL